MARKSFTNIPIGQVWVFFVSSDFFLNKTGLVSIKILSKSRKYVLLIIFVLTAIATPPDVVSQVTLAIPLYLLFELGILISYFVNWKKTSQNKQGQFTTHELFI